MPPLVITVTTAGPVIRRPLLTIVGGVGHCDGMRPTLTPESIQRARDFVEAHARPLERARLACLLDGAPLEVLAGELGAFQVDGGGFGRALESDCRAPEASVLATLTALDIVRMHGAPGAHPLVAQACAWLVAHVESDGDGRLVWPFLPPAAQSSPHAPWWDQSEPGQLSATFHGFLANPGCALTAHLWRHEAAAPGSVPADLLAQLDRQVLAVVEAGVSPEEVNAHDALAHLVGELSVPGRIRAVTQAYLHQVLPSRVMRRPEQFASYGIHPLWITPEPAHPLSPALVGVVDVALDLTIRAQQEDGSWAPFWDWGGWYPDVWQRAEQEWRGSLIVRNLHALRSHGRVGPPAQG